MKPRFRVGPVAIGSPDRDGACSGRLLDRQPGEIAEFDDFGTGRFLRGQSLQRFVQSQQERLNQARGELVATEDALLRLKAEIERK